MIILKLWNRPAMIMQYREYLEAVVLSDSWWVYVGLGTVTHDVGTAVL